MPVPLDEYPVHQAPLSLARVATSDRNFYDRSYFNAHDRSSDTFLVTGLGVYPNLGVIDAYATVRRGQRQWIVRFSDALDARGLEQRVGGYRIEVLEPLHQVRVICEGGSDSISFDLTWTGAFPAVEEEPHLLLSGARPILDACRFAQVGSWSGVLDVAGEEFQIDSEVWTGSRDRSWGIRPVGESEPPGRGAGEPTDGFFWLYVPLRFDEFAIIVILQENPDGYRTLNDAKRVRPDGAIEQLGWPRATIGYRTGTRHPDWARLELTAPNGKPLIVDVRTMESVALHVGAGYGGDADWSHGQWMGRNWTSSSVYDLDDPAISALVPYGVIDHSAVAVCDGAQGWGMLEHANLGRHDPSGFADWSAVAP